MSWEWTDALTTLHATEDGQALEGIIVPYGVAGRLDTFVQVRFRGVTSNTITLPVFTPQTIGDVYRVEVKFNIAGSVLEAYAHLFCER